MNGRKNRLNRKTVIQIKAFIQRIKVNFVTTRGDCSKSIKDR